MKRSTAPRNPPHLSELLNMYATAATAAGVSLLASASPAEAKIICTEVHQTIGTNGLYPLIFTSDGTIDFLILQSGNPSYAAPGNGLGARPLIGNSVVASVSAFGITWAAALKKGSLIGSKQEFKRNYGGSTEAGMVGAQQSGSRSFASGPWVNVANRYLGLKFRIDGKTHYGWARLSVQVIKQRYITAKLTGYAYETIPGKAIRAGQTHGQKDDTVVKPASGTDQPASLGGLALGAANGPLWRRP
jgi:hypothetical protein